MDRHRGSGLEWSNLDGHSKSVTLQSYVIKNNQTTLA